MTQENLTVRDGKFYRGREIVPAEFGNKEQIELLKRVEEMQKEGFYPETHSTKTIHMQFQCVCGIWNTFEFPDIEFDDDDSVVAGEIDRCDNCRLFYRVTTDELGDLMLKLIPKPEKLNKS